ncbi:PepSY-like domain-containing protein [Filimonas effusa]|uniref:Putative beta-lactamase-inhibitor-like PepSY-like domain-containing protein n=1 Tax=Filimonas effusa TaxID=2508721 RepID=A0A4Q1D3S8_9BACT|nr:PepSY-like domain-containing protein [Filimonas effusa]RXK83092.1 hypothetical protein ESB13_13285 [Filimonas effusa]
MKKIIAAMLILTVCAGSVMGQIRKMPSEVTNAFKEMFPKAENVSWKDNLTSWHAEFTNGGVETHAWFTSKGEWKETNKMMAFEALPEAVKDGLEKSKYHEWTPGEVAEVTKKDKSLQYRIYVEKSSLVQKKYLYFNAKGQLQREAQTL